MPTSSRAWRRSRSRAEPADRRPRLPGTRRDRHAEGAKRVAVLDSIISTCALQGVESRAYLTDVLQRLANGEDPAALTPRAWKAPRLAVTVAIAAVSASTRSLVDGAGTTSLIKNGLQSK